MLNEKNNVEQEQEQEVEINEIKEQVDTQEEVVEENVKSYTQEQLNEIIKNNVDRAVAKERKQAEKQKQEAEKLAKMNAEEKIRYQLEQREIEIAEREKAINLREIKAEAKAILIEKGLSSELSDLLNYYNAETVKDSIDKLSDAIKIEAEKLTKEILKGNASRIVGTNKAITKNEILQVEDDIKRKRLIEENIHLFN